MKSNIHKTRIVQIRAILAETPWLTLAEMALALNVSRWTVKDTIIAEGSDLQSAPKIGDIPGKVPTVYALPGAAPQGAPAKVVSATPPKAKDVRPPRSPRLSPVLPAAPAAAPTDPLQAAINLLADALIDRIADRVRTGLADRIGRMTLDLGETMPVDVVALVNDVCDRAQAAPAILAEPLPTPEIPSPFAKIVPGVALGDIDIPVIRKPAVVAKKKRVCVVGLKSEQAGIIESEFKGCLDLTFLDIGVTAQRVKSVVKNCDASFTMIKFINHGIFNVCKNNSPENHMVHGGMSQLRDALTAYFVEA